MQIQNGLEPQEGLPADLKPRISIITANYNYANYIEKTIQSVLSQEYKNIEYIVVDDGSTDNSLDVISKYDEIILISKPNGGQVSAVIEGVKKSSGDIIIFLDSDDVLYPYACNNIVDNYDPDVCLYQFKLDIMNTRGEMIGSYPDRPFLTTDHACHVLRHGAFPSSPTSGNAFSTKHVRRMLSMVGDDLRYFVDGYLIYSAPFLGRITAIDIALGQYLVHGENVSLSAGVNRTSAEKGLRNALWQRSGIVNALRLSGRDPGFPEDHLTAWYYRYLLILRRCYGVRDIAPNLSDWSVARRAARRFLDDPYANKKQRLLNLVLIGTLMTGIKSLGRRVVPSSNKQ
jgi:glycosyltransferase involved in cell wall biosynthesis